MRRWRNRIYLSLPPPPVRYPLPLAVLLEYFLLTLLSCTSWEQASQHHGTGNCEARAAPTAGEGSGHTSWFSVLAATEVLGERQQVSNGE